MWTSPNRMLCIGVDVLHHRRGRWWRLDPQKRHTDRRAWAITATDTPLRGVGVRKSMACIQLAPRGPTAAQVSDVGGARLRPAIRSRPALKPSVSHLAFTLHPRSIMHLLRYLVVLLLTTVMLSGCVVRHYGPRHRTYRSRSYRTHQHHGGHHHRRARRHHHHW